MKKLPIVLCLMFLCIALFNSRVYAVFITDITFFEQSNGSATFTDTFGDDSEPPSGGYVIESPFGLNRESDGKLELNSDDAIPDEEGDKSISAAVSDKTNFFTKDTTGQYVEGWFDFTGGLPNDPFTFFGIAILNFAADENGDIITELDPAGEQEAWLGVVRDFSGHLRVEWGDESQFDPLGFADLGLVGSTTIGLKLEIYSDNNVSAWVDYGGGFISPVSFEGLNPSDFTSLDFTAMTEGVVDIFTGAFQAGEDFPVPEPATIALLGIGLVGLAGGRYFRKKIKRKK